MEFTSYDYLIFLFLLLGLYWSLPYRRLQNALLLISSYLFYGYVHPWFCTLIAASTVLDYTCALGIERIPSRKRLFLYASLIGNLGLLATFKYFNFFVENVQALGFFESWRGLSIMLPVGISFYTFQTLSYTIDVYRGDDHARGNFLDFAVFVSFFPQLVAGPIERASRLLPQLEAPRFWKLKYLKSALSLFLVGYMKKLVVADNIAPWVDRVFMLQHPSLFLLFCGSVGFAIQIYADFSAYTDIARGSARLLGLELMENFRSPFLALSPSDFWRRWHISFSSWIRDYLYIPLGGSRVQSTLHQALILLTTMGLSGLWHGAAWNFVAWGLFHACLLITYRSLGFSAKWQPHGRASRTIAWMIFQSCNIFAWCLFRTPSLGWLWQTLKQPIWGLQGADWLVGWALLLYFLTYCSLWLSHRVIRELQPRSDWWLISWQWASCSAILMLANRDPQQFIYFQF